VISREFRQVLVDVKHNGNGDNQDNGVDIGTYELLDDIPVHSLDILEWIVFLQRLKAVPW
jgi:hypothetical protein